VKDADVIQKKKPRGKNIDDDDEEDGPADRFQQNVWCSLGEINNAIKLLKEVHRSKVEEAGVGCVFD
jgi:hypothetical protein